MKTKFVIWATVFMLLGSFTLACGVDDSEDTTLVATAAATTTTTGVPWDGHSDLVQEERDEQVRIYLEADHAQKQQAKAAAREAARKAQEARNAELRASRAAALRTDAQPDTSGLDDAFWKRLSNCESPSGAVGLHIGYFQFSRDTAAKVGIDGSESYEVQKDAAIRWLGLIGGKGGSRSGWPHCWWVALRG